MGPIALQKGISVLNTFSLIRASTDGRTYSVHPLVHSWSRDRLPEGERQIQWRSAGTLLSDAITLSKLDEDDSFRRSLVPHAQAYYQHAYEMKISEMYNEMEFVKLGLVYAESGHWAAAGEMQLQVLETRKRLLGEEHPDTLMSMKSLATTHWNQGRWTEAEVLQIRLCEAQRQVLGEKHSDTLASINDLAVTYLHQGRWTEAEELLVRLLEMQKDVLGEEHPSTLTNMNNLASTPRLQGALAEAEELEVQLVEIRRRVFGNEHPDILTAINNLALT